jgi:hypothetical protein
MKHTPSPWGPDGLPDAREVYHILIGRDEVRREWLRWTSNLLFLVYYSGSGGGLGYQFGEDDREAASDIRTALDYLMTPPTEERVIVKRPPYRRRPVSVLTKETPDATQ